MSVTAIVFAAVLALAGAACLVWGIWRMARSQPDGGTRSGLGGGAFGVQVTLNGPWPLVVSGFGVVMLIVAPVLVILQPGRSPAASSASPSRVPATASARSSVSSGLQKPKFVVLGKLVSGDCLQVPKYYAKSKASRLHFWRDIPWPAAMSVVPCGQPHGAEVYFAGNLWSAQQPFPGDKAINRKSNARCISAFTVYVGVSLDQSSLYFTSKVPGVESWINGDRHVFCAAYDSEGNNLQGSIRGSAE